MELKHHPEEWFFLHNFDIDKVFSTIQRADYLILYYIKVEQEAHPGEKLYLADLAAAMGLRVTELSKGIEKLQDNGFVAWKTDREAGRTYVELSSKAVELMAEEQALFMRRRAKEKTAERLKQYLSDCLLAVDIHTLETARNKITFRKSESVEIEDMSALCKSHPELVKQGALQADKPAVKKLLMSGVSVRGCSLRQSLNMQLK